MTHVPRETFDPPTRMDEQWQAEQDAYFPEFQELKMDPLNEIGAALAKAQAEMTNPAFDTENPFFKSRYASLAAVRNAVVPILAKHGVSCLQDLRNEPGGVTCTTILTHAGGQQIVLGPLFMPVAKSDAQGFGSASTYARRYQLMAVACVAGDADDDANAASGKPVLGQRDHGHQPMGVVDITPESAKFAEAFKTALAGDDPLAVKQVHMDLQEEGEEAYRATWSLLDSKTRAAIKKILGEKAA